MTTTLDRTREAPGGGTIPARLTIRRFPAFQAGAERLWTLDLLEAEIGGEPAGYLKVSYIPAATFRRELPDAVHFAVRRQGAYLGLRAVPLDRPLTEWTDADLARAIQAARPTGRWDVPLASLSRAGLERLWAAARDQITQGCAPEYERFRAYWVDRPQVDFIRVRGEDDDSMLIGGVPQPVDGPRNFRRQGVAMALYREAALWMAELGMSLHASDLQSEGARAAWQRLEQTGLVARDETPYGTRRHLTAGAIREDGAGLG